MFIVTEYAVLILLKILWKMEYLLKGANAPFSIIFSKTSYFKGIKAFMIFHLIVLLLDDFYEISSISYLFILNNFFFFFKILVHTGQCKRTGGCYNELVVAFFSTGGGVKRKKIFTC